ncbi:MAG: DNA translocase FtsK 4TM domain-containing protein, partial [Sphingomonadaceae bacterium]|nr:DNA translocase FtsK 4TM domain-containing protein [Sphingomonadaceae bacterium]
MATKAAIRPGIVPAVVTLRARQAARLAIGAGLIAAVAAVALALVTYSPGDPSFDTAAAGPARNLLGTPGAWLADALLAMFGWAAAALFVLPTVVGVRMLRSKGAAKWRRYVAATLSGGALVAAGVGLAWPDPQAALPAGTGGIAGLAAAAAGDALGASGAFGALPVSAVLATLLLLAGAALLLAGCG